MFGGGGGLNPRKMQQMMEQMGIDLDELEAESVVIRLADDTELYFESPDVTKMDARGQQTFQIVGEPTSRESTADSTQSEADGADGADDDIPEADIEIVAQRTGVSEAEARTALEAADGDLAAAIDRLE